MFNLRRTDTAASSSSSSVVSRRKKFAARRRRNNIFTDVCPSVRPCFSSALSRNFVRTNVDVSFRAITDVASSVSRNGTERRRRRRGGMKCAELRRTSIHPHNCDYSNRIPIKTRRRHSHQHHPPFGILLIRDNSPH